MKIHIPSIPEDKYQHIIAGVLMFCAFHFLFGFWAIAPSLTIAAFKEEWDGSRAGHTRDLKDFDYTMAGVFVAALCFVPQIVYWFA